MVATIAPTQVLTFTHTINAPLDQVWQSFVNRDDLCDWLCYNALLDPREGGHIFLTWYDGQHPQGHASGTILTVEEKRKLAFTWHDAHYSGQTKVKIGLEGDENGPVTLTLHHKGFDDATPPEVIQHYQDFWDYHLKDLRSILETGGKASIMDRVIVGIYPDQLTEETAQRLGIPVNGGVRVGSVVPGYSAEAAGMRTDDVIVAVAGVALKDSSIAEITRTHRPGDVVTVTFYRDGEKHTVEVALKGYPVPPIPKNAAEMAEQHRERYAQLNQRLDEVLAGVSDAAATEARLSDDQYSIKETLAFLILQQRHTLQYLASYAEGPRIITPFAYNRPFVKAVAQSYESVSALRDELKRTQAETVQVVANFTNAIFERKNHAWFMTFELQNAPITYEQHLTHMQQTLEAATAV